MLSSRSLYHLLILIYHPLNLSLTTDLYLPARVSQVLGIVS